MSQFPFALEKKTVVSSLVVGGAFVSLLGGYALWSRAAQKAEQKALTAFFYAEKAYAEEWKKESDGSSQKSKEGLTDKKTAFSVLDVDQTLPLSIQKWKDVCLQYPKTKTAQEARLRLARLYFQQGQWLKSGEWFLEAKKHASTPQDKAFILANLGYVKEGLQEFDQGISFFRQALEEGKRMDQNFFKTLKGDWLLAWAHCEEAKQAWEEARKIYSQVIQELPQSPQAQFAQLSQDLLPHAP